MKRIISLLILVLSVSLPLEGQTNKYGIFAHFNYNLHSPNFEKLPGIPNCCPNFRTGSGAGYSAGLLFEMPLSQSLLASFRAGYYDYSGTLEDRDFTTVLVKDELTRGEFKHIIESKLSAIGFEALLGAEVFNNAFLYFGINGGFYVSGSFRQYESLSKPENAGVFADTKTRKRNDTSGTIPDMNGFAYSFEFGASYELFLNKEKTLIAAPEIFYTLGLNDVSGSVNWRVNTLRVGVALKYWPHEPPQVRDELRREMRIDTIKILSKLVERDTYLQGSALIIDKSEILTDYIRTITEIYSRTDTIYLVDRAKPAEGIKEYKVYSYGKEAESNSIYINQQFVTQAFPLLPVIYFEKNSSDIPLRYKKTTDAGDFNVNELEANPVNYHHNILNIIGSRLKSNPGAKITLEGYADAFTEDGDCKLAGMRAEEVKSYFVSAWNIEPQRIDIKVSTKKCYPGDYTRTPNEYGYQENRRVKIQSADKEILSPIDKKRYLETLTISPVILAHKLEADNEAEIAEWFISASQGGNIQVLSDAGLGKPGIIEHQVTETIAGRLVSGEPLDFSMRIKYKNGETHQTQFSIPVQKDTSDVEVERLSLAIFNVSGNTLREVDKKAIESFLGELKPTDTVSVAGYTDMLGDPEENAALSQRRADIVCSQIKEIFGKLNRVIDIIKCQGVAFAFKPPQIKSYELPEERFLSRTVQIEIRRRWR